MPDVFVSLTNLGGAEAAPDDPLPPPAQLITTVAIAPTQTASRLEDRVVGTLGLNHTNPSPATRAPKRTTVKQHALKCACTRYEVPRSRPKGGSEHMRVRRIATFAMASALIVAACGSDKKDSG